MELHVLPTRTSDAAGNMALDFLLLQRYPRPEAARLRHYGWQRPAFTFGYAQKITEVRAMLPTDERIDLTRRATGGGLVDHRQDWTYALVLPRGHLLFERPGPTIYNVVHQALADALRELGVDARLHQRSPDANVAAAAVCFVQPEPGDVVRADNGRKIAGAAMKRGKHALLLQGSIWRPSAREVANWSNLEDQLTAVLAKTLAAEITAPGWPDFSPEEEEALVAQYADPEWIERR